MRRRFGRGSGYRRVGGWHLPCAREHVWPVARAFVATLDLAGTGWDADAEIAAHLEALAQYWDPRLPRAYASDPPGSWFGGDRYHDDNAWIGLGLIQLERMRPGSSGPGLARARELFAFARGGWDTRTAGVPAPGGVFWVEQGRGIGRRNHDRNAVSTAPNAQIALHLAALGGGGGDDVACAQRMIAWVQEALTDPGTGALFRDKIRGDGSIDAALWSYNQGSMLGAHVLCARLGVDGALARAEAIAGAALTHYAQSLIAQPPAFNAILLRNLLLLWDATADPVLRAEITAMLRGYADAALAGPRDRHGLFALGGEPVTLLDQSAFVSVLALCAWDPAQYGRVA